MKRQLTLNLDEKAYQRLLQHCQGDENALQEFAARILENQLPDAPQSAPEITPEELKEYLKKGAPGSRSYGIKGQGW